MIERIDNATENAGYNASIVASVGNYNNMPALHAEAEEASMTDVVKTPSALEGQKFKTLIEPRDNKTLREQNKNKNFYTEGNAPAIERTDTKLNNWMAVMYVAGLALEKIGEENLSAIQGSARSQSVTALNKVVGLMQNEIDKGSRGLIPEKYQDSYYLVDLANYLLSGRKISGYDSKQNDELKKIGDQMISNYFAPIRQKERAQEEKNQRKKIVDNVRTGTGAGN